MGKEFINNIPRYCLWLKGINPKELKSMPAVLERVRRCKEDRLNGAKDRQKLAATLGYSENNLILKKHLRFQSSLQKGESISQWTL